MKDKENFILLTDSYKLTHHGMYLEGLENIYSYFESREGAKYPYTVFFGLQMILKRYFEGVVVTKQDVIEADEFSKQHFGQDVFNRDMWNRIVDVHGGKLPLLIKAVPEGTAVPVGNVLMTVEVTDEKCFPLTNVVETILTHLWYPSNVATISHDIKSFLAKAFKRSADTNTLLPFMFHDFGFRGVSSVESAGMGGAGHLVSFMGTDTLIGIIYAQRYYGAGMAGYSVPATEHSIMTSIGQAGEMQMAYDIIKKYPDGILSMVSDSYNIEDAVECYGTVLKDDILARNGKFVVRPDSPRFEGDTPKAQILWLVRELDNYFGGSVNSKGYRVLNPKVGVIYGDGLSVEEIKDAVNCLTNNGYSAESCVFGMGGGLLQKHNRDTQRNAFKCSAQKRNGEWRNVWKSPMDKTKASKKGRLKLLLKEQNRFFTVPEINPEPDFLRKVFLNGVISKEYTWIEVINNSNKGDI